MKTIQIEWIDSISAGVTGYKVFRDDIEIADVAPGVQTYDDPTAVEGETYKYEVQAYSPTEETTEEQVGVNVKNITVSGGVVVSPAYVDSGALAEPGATATVSVAYPATVNENDILILRVLSAGDETFTTPAGWTVLTTETSADASYILFWKRAVGTEAGAEDVVVSASNPSWGKMDRFSGCVTSGTPYEGLDSTGWISDINPTFSNSNLSTLDNSLAVAWVTQEDDQLGTNESVGYIQHYLDVSTIASDGTLGLLSQELVTAADPDGTVDYNAAAARPTVICGVILKSS